MPDVVGWIVAQDSNDGFVRTAVSSPHVMGHFLIEFPGRVASYREPDAGGYHGQFCVGVHGVPLSNVITMHASFAGEVQWKEA